MIMGKELRVGIAGYGATGKRRHEVVKDHPKLKTVAICDQIFDSSKSKVEGVTYLNNYQELLEIPLDIVLVCLPNYLAPEVTITALSKGCHVFCEKPPGRDLSDIERVISHEHKHPDLKLMYGFNHRYHFSVQDALHVIRDKELGKVINIRGIYGKSKLLNFAKDWRTNRAFSGGGILLDQGIHMVDLIRLFAGDFVEVYGFISNDFWHHDVEDNAYALMRTKDGIIGMLHSSATEWRHRFRLEITLELGTITLSGILTSSKSYGAEKITVAYASDRANGDPIEKTTHYDEDNSWRDEIYDFTDSIINDKKIEFGSSSEAKKTMELVYKIYEADKEWCSRFNIT